jgi:1,4-alpha-glucan branching enzyme
MFCLPVYPPGFTNSVIVIWLGGRPSVRWSIENGNFLPPIAMPKKEQTTGKEKVIRDPFLRAIERIAFAENSDPFAILGPHWIERDGRQSLAIRAFRPGAASIELNWRGSPEAHPAKQIHPKGLFEAVLTPDTADLAKGKPVLPGDYRLRIRYPDGAAQEILDPYAFPPLLSDFDIYLSGEGTHFENYEKLGAHVREVSGVRGVQFAVWAPNAMRVSVVGDFNQWDGRVHPMRNRGPSGIWEIFIPELKEDALYKFEVRSRVGDYLALKSDPYGFAAELRPHNASVVSTIDGYEWHDRDWLDSRASRDWLHSPMSIYEFHAGAWRWW